MVCLGVKILVSGWLNSSYMLLVLFKDGSQDESSGGRDAAIIRGRAKRNKIKVRDFIAILFQNSTPILWNRNQLITREEDRQQKHH